MMMSSGRGPAPSSSSSSSSSAAVKAVVRVGVGCLITHKAHPQCILLGIRKGSHGAGKWAAPGGHLELGESWYDCGYREVKEETNLHLEKLTFLHVTVKPFLNFKSPL